MTTESRPQLKKEISAAQFFTLGFGTIIGVGWVVVLGQWLAKAGPLGAILGFAGGGLIMMLVALCYAEMSSQLPVAGGEVAYSYELYGVNACFAIGWAMALIYVATTTFEAVSVGWVASALFPGFDGPILYTVHGDAVRLGSLLLGLGGMALLTYLNYRGAKAATRFQDILTYGVLGCSLVFITAGLVWGKAANLEPLFQHSSSVGMGIAGVLVTAPFWYGGFNVIPQAIEETAPGTSVKMVGRMILLSLFFAGAFYCLVILSASMSMPWRDLLDLELPAAGAFEAALGSPWLADLVLLAAFFGIITTWNAVFLAGSRVLFALGRARIIPPAFAGVHETFRSPATAVLFVGIVGSAGVFLGRSAIVPIVNVGATCLTLGYLITCWGVIKMRRDHPHQERPFRAPGGIATASLAVLGCLFMLFMTLYQPYQSAQGFLSSRVDHLLGLGFAGSFLLARRATHARKHQRSGAAEADLR
jgi:amino acid transporter